MNYIYPEEAKHRITELNSDNISYETKGNIARWYAEMIVKKFLSDYFLDEKYKNESLGYLINNLKDKVDCKIIESLFIIKQFGDDAAHYNPDKQTKPLDYEKAITESLNLYKLVIIDLLKKTPLNSYPDRYSLISVLLPQMRVEIYDELIATDNAAGKDIDLEKLQKWGLACLKSGNVNKAKRKYKKLLKNESISKDFYDERIAGLRRLEIKMTKGELPIPNDRSDFSRNLHDLLTNHLTEGSIRVNVDLVAVLRSMADSIEPSEMSDMKGMQRF